MRISAISFDRTEGVLPAGAAIKGTFGRLPSDAACDLLYNRFFSSLLNYQQIHAIERAVVPAQQLHKRCEYPDF